MAQTIHTRASSANRRDRRGSSRDVRKIVVTYDGAGRNVSVKQEGLGGTKPTASDSTGPCEGNLHVYSPKNRNGRGGYGKFYAKFRVNCGATGYRVSVLKVTRNFHRVGGDPIRYSSRLPDNAAGEHWQGEWGNWTGKKATQFDCLNGMEYEYTYEIQIEWTSIGGVVGSGGGKLPQKPGAKSGAILEPGGGSLTLTAQEHCNHGRY